MKTEINNRHVSLSAAARRQYDRDVVILEQQAEDALCLHHGALAKLRQASDPSHEGRRSRREWLSLVNQYLAIVNPPAPDYPESEEAWSGSEKCACDSAENFVTELRNLVSSPRRVVTILAIIAFFWLIACEIGAFR